MQLRLAFAVAAHLEPEIVLIDEVLAVGDAVFQQRCVDKMNEMAGEGETILYVSHNLPSVSNLCERAIILKKGKLNLMVLQHLLLERYIEASFDLDSEIEGSKRFEDANKTEDVKLISVKLYQGKNKQNTSIINISETSKIEIVYEVLRDGLVLHPNIHVHDTMGTPILSSGDLPGFSSNNEKTYSNKPHKPGVYVSECDSLHTFSTIKSIVLVLF